MTSRIGLLVGGALCLVLGAVDLGLLNLWLVPAVWPTTGSEIAGLTPSRSETIGVPPSRSETVALGLPSGPAAIAHAPERSAAVGEDVPGQRADDLPSGPDTVGSDLVGEAMRTSAEGLSASRDSAYKGERLLPSAGGPSSGADSDGSVENAESLPDTSAVGAGVLEAVAAGSIGFAERETDPVRIYFETGEYTISSAAADVLEGIIRRLKAAPTSRVSVEGHSDQRGEAAFNEYLSGLRASAVVSHLTQQGIDPSRIGIHYFGATQPIDPENNPASWRRNRRVELRILKGAP